MLWEHTFMVAVFWYMLGYMSYYVKKYDHNDESFNFKAPIPNKKQSINKEIDSIDIPTDE